MCIGMSSNDRCESLALSYESYAEHRCAICGSFLEHDDRNPYVVDIGESARILSDVVQNSGAREGCVTERVVDGLVRHGLKGWDAVPLFIPEWILRRFRDPPPDLFLLRTHHWGELDAEASGIGDCTYCASCGSITANPQEPSSLVINPDTFDWEASDFFRFHPWGQSGLFVTRRVIEVARIEHWTGAIFIPLGIPYNTSAKLRNSIDPLAKEWPPTHHWD